jgi:site-specific recombinase XerC
VRLFPPSVPTAGRSRALVRTEGLPCSSNHGTFRGGGACWRRPVTADGIFAEYGWKAERRESLEPGAPLFCSQSRWRISKGWVQVALRQWQERAGLDRQFDYTRIRHAVRCAYEESRCHP